MTIARFSAKRVAVVLALVGIGFFLFEYPFRVFETMLSGGLLHALHVPGVVSSSGVYTYVRQHGTNNYIALEMAPQCSSLPAVLGIFALASPMVPTAGRRVYRGALLASVIAVVGNIVRTDAVLAVGIGFGFISLVFFHTWVAAIFDFAAVLLGWILMVRMQLPKSADDVPGAPAQAAHPGPPGPGTGPHEPGGAGDGLTVGAPGAAPTPATPAAVPVGGDVGRC